MLFMNEQALDKKQILTELTKSAHGALAAYLPIGRRAAIEDPDFFSHLVAWDHHKGQIRDAKLALPVIALAALRVTSEANRLGVGELRSDLLLTYADNALAHLADLRPREFAKAVLPYALYDKTTKKSVAYPPFGVAANAPRKMLRRLVNRYLKDLEANRRSFEYTAVQHGQILQNLYAHYHVACPSWVSQVLFRRQGSKTHGPIVALPPAPGIFEVIARLHLLNPVEAAGTIVKFKIPFLIARGALGAKAKDPDTVLALIKAMSPTELVTNVKWLEKLGVKTHPALRAAFEQAIGKAAMAKTPKATLKTTRAAEALADDEALSGKLHALQEKQIDKLGGVEGDWLVLGDKSGSMHSSIDVARNVAGTLARMVKGRVHLIFFDTAPRYVEVTGKTLEDIKKLTAGVQAGGGTNMHCGIQYALDAKLKVDGIAFVSDGANHGAEVIPVYKRYCEKLDCEPTLYFYKLDGEQDVFSHECREYDVDLQTFDLLGQTVDYYSLPTLATTMRVQRYSLIDEVLNTPLRTLDEVLDQTKGMHVLPQMQKVIA